MKKKFIVKITETDAVFILGIDSRFLKVAERTVFCGNCTPSAGKSAVIAPGCTFFVNDLGDILLKGVCKQCGEPVGRYIESGETPASFKRAMKVIKRKTS